MKKASQDYSKQTSPKPTTQQTNKRASTTNEVESKRNSTIEHKSDVSSELVVEETKPNKHDDSKLSTKKNKGVNI